jgi:hypothetical protein
MLPNHASQVSAPQPVPEHGVTVVFVELPNTKIELLHPLGEKSPIQKFLDRNPAGEHDKISSQEKSSRLFCGRRCLL